MIGVSPAKTERNIEIYRDYLSGGFTQAQMVAKYGVSTARIYELVDRMRLRYPQGVPEIQEVTVVEAPKAELPEVPQPGMIDYKALDEEEV